MSSDPALLETRGLDEYDEVERRDRGGSSSGSVWRILPDLRRKPKRARKRQVDARATRLQLDSARRASYQPMPFATGLQLPPSDLDRPLSAGIVPPSPYLPPRADSALGLGFPSTPSANLAIRKPRTASRAGLRDSIASTSTVTGDESDAGCVTGSYYSSEGEEVCAPRGASPRFLARPLRRGISVSSYRSQVRLGRRSSRWRATCFTIESIRMLWLEGGRDIGQVIENLSSNLYTSTTHRVLLVPSTSTHSRLSIPFFFSPVLTSPLPPIPLSSLHPELAAQALNSNTKEVKSEVRRGDLNEVIYGWAAWRGITRSHVGVWERWYGRERDAVGGPERK